MQIQEQPKKRGGARVGAGRPLGKEKTKPVRLPLSLIGRVMDFVEGVEGKENDSSYELPLFFNAVSAGFPSPADDFIEARIDLNKQLVKHPTATFLVRVVGDSMINAGIRADDILIVDRSIEPRSGQIVVAAINGELTVKRYHKTDEGVFLLPENESYFLFINHADEFDIPRIFDF